MPKPRGRLNQHETGERDRAFLRSFYHPASSTFSDLPACAEAAGIHVQTGKIILRRYAEASWTDNHALWGTTKPLIAFYTNEILTKSGIFKRPASILAAAKLFSAHLKEDAEQQHEKSADGRSKELSTNLDKKRLKAMVSPSATEVV